LSRKPAKARRKGIISLDMFQALFILLAVLLLMLGSSLKIRDRLEGSAGRQSAAMLAMEIAARLDSFQRNACGGGFCYASFAVAGSGSSISFLPDGVVVGNGISNATARTSFPLGPLNLTVEDSGTGSRITVRGSG